MNMWFFNIHSLIKKSSYKCVICEYTYIDALYMCMNVQIFLSYKP